MEKKDSTDIPGVFSFGPAASLDPPRDLPLSIAEGGIEGYILYRLLCDIEERLSKGERGREMLVRREELLRRAAAYHPGHTFPASLCETGTLSEKVYIPAEEYPDLNFVGFMIGPRGETLRRLEKELGCKLSIKGRGSTRGVVEIRPSARAGAPAEEEPLHCTVAAEDRRILDKAVTALENLVEDMTALLGGESRPKRRLCREGSDSGAGGCREEREAWKGEGPSKKMKRSAMCGECGDAGHGRTECIFQKRPPAREQQELELLESEYRKCLALSRDSVEEKLVTAYYEHYLRQMGNFRGRRKER